MEETVPSGRGLGTFAPARAWPQQKTRCLASCCTQTNRDSRAVLAMAKDKNTGTSGFPKGMCADRASPCFGHYFHNYSVNAPSLLIELVLAPRLNCWLRLGSTECAMQCSGAWVLQSLSGFRYGPRGQKETGLIKLFGIIAQPSW